MKKILTDRFSTILVPSLRSDPENIGGPVLPIENIVCSIVSDVHSF